MIKGVRFQKQMAFTFNNPKRYFFNSIQPTKLTNQHVSIFKASMTNVMLIVSILWGIESNQKKFKAELAYHNSMHNMYIACIQNEIPISVCNKIKKDFNRLSSSN
jgi:hypothetical protein